uniref:Antifreeze protein n=1 Tax=Acrobeloides nanus TaxID=290746 RepID=A0A914EBM5_9BILA
MFKIFAVGMTVACMTILFDQVNSQCGCNCIRFNRCSCCRTSYLTYNTTSQRVCSSTCADTLANCYLYIASCSTAFYQAVCACTCGVCSTTVTNVCTGLLSGANIGPCINNACGTGAYCNTTSQNCMCP